jgi:hypothetical protein
MQAPATTPSAYKNRQAAAALNVESGNPPFARNAKMAVAAPPFMRITACAVARAVSFELAASL